MQLLIERTFSRAARCFVAGVLTILPLVITVAVIAWCADFLRRLLGPGTMIGEGIRSLGLRFASDTALAYLLGSLVVLTVIFVIGLVVEAGARTLIQRLLDAVLRRIPLVGSIYGTSRQMVAMLDKTDNADLKGMQAVFCIFGKEHGAGVLALLVSSERFQINERDYQIVIVPTAPVPIGGGLLFVPSEHVQPTDLSVEKLMSIYVSLGVTARQLLPTMADQVK